MEEAPVATSGIAVGLNKGHIVTRRAKLARPAHRKGVRALCRLHVVRCCTLARCAAFSRLVAVQRCTIAALGCVGFCV